MQVGRNLLRNIQSDQMEGQPYDLGKHAGVTQLREEVVCMVVTADLYEFSWCVTE